MRTNVWQWQDGIFLGVFLPCKQHLFTHSAADKAKKCYVIRQCLSKTKQKVQHSQSCSRRDKQVNTDSFAWHINDTRYNMTVTLKSLSCHAWTPPPLSLFDHCSNLPALTEIRARCLSCLLAAALATWCCRFCCCCGLVCFFANYYRRTLTHASTLPIHCAPKSFPKAPQDAKEKKTKNNLMHVRENKST